MVFGDVWRLSATSEDPGDPGDPENPENPEKTLKTDTLEQLHRIHRKTPRPAQLSSYYSLSLMA